MAPFPSALSRGWRRLLRASPAVVPFVDSQHAYRPAAAIVSDCRCHGIPSSGLCWHAVWGFDDLSVTDLLRAWKQTCRFRLRTWWLRRNRRPLPPFAARLTRVRSSWTSSSAHIRRSCSMWMPALREARLRPRGHRRGWRQARSPLCLEGSRPSSSRRSCAQRLRYLADERLRRRVHQEPGDVDTGAFAARVSFSGRSILGPALR